MTRFENALVILGNKPIKVQLCQNVAYLISSKDLVEEVSFVELARLLRNAEVRKHSRNFWKVLQNRLQ